MQVVTGSYIFVSHNFNSRICTMTILAQKHINQYRIILSKAQKWPNRVILYQVLHISSITVV